MNSLKDKIQNFDYYEKEFDTWEPTEIIIDENRAFWMLKKPDSECRKVCMFRDRYMIFVYGDYGNFCFDQMTWIGSVYNLAYDNIGYQFSKLSRDSKDALKAFDTDTCIEDLEEWFIETLEELKDDYNIENPDEIAKSIFQYIKENDCIFFYDEEELCKKYDCFEYMDLVQFVNNAYCNCDDEYDWISYLRESNLGDFEDKCESSLWNAGRKVSQSYYINMYALQVCRDKLEEKAERI